MRGLDLFSGIGGITLALKDYVTPVAYCEIDPYCAGVLFSRMLDGSLPRAPVFPDVRKLTAKVLPSIDIVYGGFPCQDISQAGTRKGLEGERSGLFFEIIRLANETKPMWIFLENVAAINTLGLATVTAEISKMGYDCRWITLSAEEVGAPHKRERWWLLAYSNSEQLRSKQEQISKCESAAELKSNGINREMADTNGIRLEGGNTDKRSARTREIATTTRSDWWAIEPDVGRVAHGIPFRVDRIKGLGNAVVPQCAKEAFEKLMGL